MVFSRKTTRKCSVFKFLNRTVLFEFENTQVPENNLNYQNWNRLFLFRCWYTWIFVRPERLLHENKSGFRFWSRTAAPSPRFTCTWDLTKYMGNRLCRQLYDTHRILRPLHAILYRKIFVADLDCTPRRYHNHGCFASVCQPGNLTANEMRRTTTVAGAGCANRTKTRIVADIPFWFLMYIILVCAPNLYALSLIFLRHTINIILHLCLLRVTL